jgi:hypothetical protein
MLATLRTSAWPPLPVFNTSNEFCVSAPHSPRPHTHTQRHIALAVLTPIRHQTACLQILVMIIALCTPAWPPLPCV